MLQYLEDFCRSVNNEKEKIACLQKAVIAVADRHPILLNDASVRTSIKNDVCEPYKARATKNCNAILTLVLKIPPVALEANALTAAELSSKQIKDTRDQLKQASGKDEDDYID